MSWFAMEKAVYYKLFWLPLGLLLLEVLVGFVLNFLGDIGPALFFLLPYLMVFTSAVFALWGAVLVLLGLRQRQSVVALALATIASSSPLLIVLAVFVRIRSLG